MSSLYIYRDWQLSVSIQQVIDQINNQVGYQVLKQNYNNNKLHLLVLHSPMAISLEDLVEKFTIQNFKLIINEKLTSLDSPELFIPYLTHKYKSTLSTLGDGKIKDLIVSGTISSKDLSRLKQDRLVENYFNLILSKNLILTVDISSQEKNRQEIETLVNSINSQYFYFDLSSAQLLSDSRASLNKTIAQIKRVILLEKMAGVSIKQISVSGYADSRGSKRPNLDLSSERAKSIESMLKANGITENLIISWGYGTQDLVTVPNELQRRARIEVLYVPNSVSNL